MDENKRPKLLEVASIAQKTAPKQDLPSISNPNKPSEVFLTDRPRIMRHATAAARFSSDPVPLKTDASEDGPRSYITLVATPPPTNTPTTHPRPLPPPPMPSLGFPFPQSVSFSFNDLPYRAQHLILKELMQKQSNDTAVLLTMLPN